MTTKLRLLQYAMVAAGIFSICNKLEAQTTPTLPQEGVEITKAIPASPDAAALGKYGSIPVSPYTGVPSISVPIYTIKSGGISLPVSLSYHAGGNKVEEMASSVGLGWVLNAGGAITRTIRGKADEETFGYLDPGNYVPNILSSIQGNGPLSNATYNQFLNEISDGTMDGEADIYNFNFAGYSGKFVMDTHGNIMAIPQQRIKFTFNVGTGPDGPMILSFTAVAPDGVTYIFGSDGDLNDAVEKTNSISSCAIGALHKYYATSWFIKRIIDPLNHQVNFSYTYDNCQIGQSRTQSNFQFYYSTQYTTQNGNTVFPPMPPTNCVSSSIVSSVKLSNISFENGNLNIYANTGRLDLSNSKKIDSISIVSGTFSKKFSLYYTNNSTDRLRLDSVIGLLEPITQPSNYKKERYKFTYNADTWNKYNLFCQDYWGYNNGHFDNSSLIEGAFFQPANQSAAVWLSGANRSPDEQAMQAGMLTRITYPTGGYTAFTYEANREFNNDVGGTSSSYETPLLTIARSTDPNSGYLNYDANNGNPNDYMTISNLSGSLVQVGITGRGFYTSNDPNDPNFGNHITSALIPVDSLGNVSGPGYGINNADTIMRLPAGRYQIKIMDPKNQSATYLYTVVVTWHNMYTSTTLGYKNYIAGGLRVKQIADYDGVSTTPVNLKAYQYTLPGSDYSSGWLDYKPSYTYLTGRSVTDPTAGDNQAYYFTRSATSNYPLATTQGSVVGYSHVTELSGTSGQNGKTEYFYTNSQTSPDVINGIQLNLRVPPDPNGFPFAPTASSDWKRGQLLRQITYKTTGSGDFAKVQDKVDTYGSNYLAFSNNLKVGFTVQPYVYFQAYPYFNNTAPNGTISVFQYSDFTDFTYLATETVTDYSLTDTTKYTQTSSTFKMDSVSFLPSNVTTTNSKGEIITQTVTYPGSYNSFAGPWVPGTSSLLGKHILSYPIEEVTQKSDASGNNLRTIKAVFTTYKPSMPLRDSVYMMRSVTPVTAFVSSLSGVKDSHYQAVASFDKYDTYGNILQERKVGDALHSYIWGYWNGTTPGYNTYPIAEVINADTASIAYTNFESYNTGGYGHWNYNNSGTFTDATAPMGPKVYDVATGAVTKPNLTSATSYVVSFWYKNGATVTVTGGTVTSIATGNAKSGWIYREYKVTGTTSVAIGGSGMIDELRLYPVNAQMSTYTYVTLVGMSSKCDVKNDITYYVYDNVGRLSQVLDQNRSILKDYKYNYIDYSPTWIDNGITNCVQGPYGNTGEQLMQQTDNNPYSATYNQTRTRSLGNTANCPLPNTMFVVFRVTGTSTTVVKGYTQTWHTVEADVYSDAACTVHMNVLANLPVNYTAVSTIVHGDGSSNTTTTYPYSVTILAGNNKAVAGTFNVSGCAPVTGSDNPDCITTVVDVVAGANYVLVTGGGN